MKNPACHEQTRKVNATITRIIVGALALAAHSILPAAEVRSATPPSIPIGLDAYRQWERWPVQRIGARAYMRSTYDRRGGNEGADASHFLYQVADDFNVTLDVAGPGVLYFARYNHWHGSPWHYEVDGMDHLVRETGTSDPVNAKKTLKETVFIPEAPFPNPLTWTWTTTKGADLMWVPLQFEKSFRMAYSRTRYGTGYYIYHQYVPGAPLSRPIRPWDGNEPPDRDVLDLIRRAGTDLVPNADSPDGRRMGIKERSGIVALPSRKAVTVAELVQAPSLIRALEFDVPRDQALAFGRARLRVTWDGRTESSIEAPVALFFGVGTLYNRDDREYLVKAFPVYIRYSGKRVHLACSFPMPFWKSARVELLNSADAGLTDIRWSLRHQPCQESAGHMGYFHATCRDHPSPEFGKDLVLLDTRATEGGGDWSGSLVGTSFTFSDRAVLTTLEGDPRFFFDDSQSPQAYGTGTEEWGGGGDYWGGQNMTLPFAGHPVGAKSAADALCDEDMIESAYRFLLADLMPFGKNAVIRLEHGGANESTEHYQTVTYWYGRPGATLVKTDELKLGDPASEAAHRYVSPQASEPYEITSRYEWGPDSRNVGGEGPFVDPADFAEFEFDAVAGTYFIWVRGQNLDGNRNSDASWVQFDSYIDTNSTAPGHTHPKGVGNWLDRFPARTSAWSSALPQDPPLTATFTYDGRHRMRIQPRHPGHLIEQVWLSRAQKTLPTPETVVPGSSKDEITLKPAAATVLSGKVKLTTDGALEMNGTAPAPATTVEVYTAHTDRGRKTTGASEFTLLLDSKNLGVMLRRKLDYSFPNQRAEVSVADEKGTDWQPAGIWYLAGANTCVYSNPKDELGAAEHRVQTSNRRFRDDEFLLPRDLTAGRDAIRVRVKFTPANIPLFPGRSMDEQAWSEIRYDAYCWILPDEK